MKLISIFILVFVTQFTYAQCDDSRLYTESEKESFVQVYLQVKTQKPPSQDEILFGLVKKYNFSARHFQDILNPPKDKKHFTEKEKAFFAEIQEIEKDYKSAVEETEIKECEDQKLNFLDYTGMQKQYRSCMRFQRSLSEYFEKWK